MLRSVCFALVAAALVVIPAGMSSRLSNQAFAQATTDKGEKADKGDKSKAPKTAKKKKKREATEGQKSARERQRQCGQEWQEAKKAGKVDKGTTWPKFWSACNTRLKGKST